MKEDFFVLKVQPEMASLYVRENHRLVGAIWPAKGYLFIPGCNTFASGTTIEVIVDYLMEISMYVEAE